jgi:hypothetical protein
MSSENMSFRVDTTCPILMYAGPNLTNSSRIHTARRRLSFAVEEADTSAPAAKRVPNFPSFQYGFKANCFANGLGPCGGGGDPAAAVTPITEDGVT